MKSRSFADLVVGVLAWASLSGLAALAGENKKRARAADRRWSLATKRRRRRVAEDACRHCQGSGQCFACVPVTCRVCAGSGLQPRDRALVERLNDLWDGVT
jgi:hypothetical protein